MGAAIPSVPVPAPGTLIRPESPLTAPSAWFFITVVRMSCYVPADYLRNDPAQPSLGGTRAGWG